MRSNPSLNRRANSGTPLALRLARTLDVMEPIAAGGHRDEGGYRLGFLFLWFAM